MLRRSVVAATMSGGNLLRIGCEEKRKICQKIIEILKYLAKNKIHHGDIKLSNFLIISFAPAITPSASPNS